MILIIETITKYKQIFVFFPGFWTAAHDFNIEWLIVRGIKGFENSSHSSSVNWEKIACVMAASVVANLLSQATIFQDWPHFNAGITSCVSLSFLFTEKDLIFYFPAVYSCIYCK